MNFRPRKQHLLNLLPDAWVMTHGPWRKGVRYLTFDDGPHPEYTPEILDVLAEHGARASFFLVGRFAENHPALVKRIVAEGHLLGNHSWNHKLFARMSLREQTAEIERTDAFLAEFDHQAHHRVRPPQGHLPLPLLLHFACQRRSIAYWSYDSLDYQHGSAASIASRLRQRPPREREIILMHDDSARAVGALRLVLPQWRASGYSFEALPPEAV
jgi:peptidoglycan/xylan/chitin deacetylase (PgdA/CDA1 family)